MIFFIDDSGGGGGGSMLVDTVATGFAAQTTAHAANNPATVNAGDLLLWQWAYRSSATTTTPSGLTFIDGNTGGGVANTRWYYRIADGSEGGGATDFVTSGNARGTVTVWRFAAGTFVSTPELVIGTAASGSNPDPPSLSPSWGLANTHWMACMAQGASPGAISAYPLPDNQGTVDSGATSGVRAGWCHIDSATASLDPGAFTSTSGLAWTATTVAIRPA